MPQPPFDEKAAHRWFAVECNNQVWDWLEAPSRSSADAERMIHAAHASCFHWLHAGNVVNQQRAECLIANVYAAAGDGVAALKHAQRCVELLESHSAEMADWDRAFAFDCLARAFAAAGRNDESKVHRELAQQLGAKISDPEDKKVFDNWVAKC